MSGKEITTLLSDSKQGSIFNDDKKVLQVRYTLKNDLNNNLRALAWS